MDSINELLCGEKINDNIFRRKADETIVNVLKSNSFSLKERYDFWKKKWLMEHKSLITLYVLMLLILYGISIYFHMPILSGLLVIIAFVIYLKTRNQMMSYVESHIYDDYSK